MIKVLDISSNIIMIIANVLVGLLTIMFIQTIIENGKIGEIAIVMILYLYLIPFILITVILKLLYSKKLGLPEKSGRILKITIFLSIGYLISLCKKTPYTALLLS